MTGVSEHTIAELDRLVEREERNLEHRLRELKEAENKAASIRWQVTAVESGLKDLRRRRNAVRNQELVDQLRVLHSGNDLGECGQCHESMPCRTIRLIEEETEQQE